MFNKPCDLTHENCAELTKIKYLFTLQNIVQMNCFAVQKLLLTAEPNQKLLLTAESTLPKLLQWQPWTFLYTLAHTVTLICPVCSVSFVQSES